MLRNKREFSPISVLDQWEEAHKLSRFATGARYELKISLGLLRQYPAIYMRYAQWARPQKVVTAQSDIVIEGFRRSANWFAVTAFQQAQGGEVNIAHHTHSPAQVKTAVRMGVPNLVLIRDPDEAVLEDWLRLRRRALVRLPRVFLDYARFYEPLVRCRSGYVLGHFQEVTSDFGEVISKINARFGTRFVPFDHTPENVGRCFQVIEEGNRRKNSGRLVEFIVGRPSEERREVVEQLRSLLDRNEVGKHRTRARRVYESLMATDSG